MCTRMSISESLKLDKAVASRSTGAASAAAPPAQAKQSQAPPQQKKYGEDWQVSICPKKTMPRFYKCLLVYARDYYSVCTLPTFICDDPLSCLYKFSFFQKHICVQASSPQSSFFLVRHISEKRTKHASSFLLKDAS